MFKKSLIVLGLFLVSNCAALFSQEDTVFVLGSGGTKGLAHVGAIEELEHMGIIPSKIVGCSVGSIVAVLYAQSLDIEEVKNCLIDLSKDDFLNWTLFEENALSSRKKFIKFLDRHLKAETFSDLPIEVVIVATNFTTGESVYFSEGSLKDAILASACLPGVFAPYRIGGDYFVDGGLTDPLPILHAKSIGGKVLAIDISSKLNDFKKPDGLFSVLTRSFEIIYQRLSSSQHEEADLLLEMNFEGLKSPLDDSKNYEIYEKGKKVVLEHKDEILHLFSPIEDEYTDCVSFARKGY